MTCRGSTGSFFWVGIRLLAPNQSRPTVRTLKGLRQLHHLATTYHKRPSEILGITEPFAAHGIDQAVLLAGSLADPEKKNLKVSLQG